MGKTKTKLKKNIVKKLRPGIEPRTGVYVHPAHQASREKVKKAELKEAGQYLTPALKAAKVRADAMIEAMRAEVSLDVILQSS